MREFERALERGEDTAVATLGARAAAQDRAQAPEEDECDPPRTDDPRAACCSGRWSRFWSRAIFPIRAGPDPPRLAASDLAMARPRRRPEAAARVRGAALARIGHGRRASQASKLAVRKLQLAAADAIINLIAARLVRCTGSGR